MKISVSYSLIDFFKKEGYRYCLSKTQCVNDPLVDVCIDLTPVKYKPCITTLPEEYDTYFNLNREPMQMAAGVDRTIILMDLSTEHLLSYIRYVLQSANSYKE